LFDKEDRRARLAELVLSGLTVAAAARQVGLGVDSARQWARAAGVKRPSAAQRAAAARCEKQQVQAELQAKVIGLVKVGSTARRAAGMVGVPVSAVYRWVRAEGLALQMPQGRKDMFWQAWRAGFSVNIDMDAPPGVRLSPQERQEIALGKAAGLGVRAIAARIGRPPSTVSRELARNTGPDGRYRFLQAEQTARDKAKRPKTAKLAQEGPLRSYVVKQLTKKRSPEQITHRIRLEHPNDPEMRVCHETIYQAIYVQARGGLKQELVKATRRGRTYRQTRRKDGERRGRIPGMVPIADRPDDVEERLIPGHWEGDLILGSTASGSAVATLVERAYRYTMLGHLPDDHTAPTVRDAIVPLLAGLPEQLRKTLTWDQGSEMACHLQVAEQAGLEVYFADPHSPWQRGTNENTNGLLREYLPKGTDLSKYSPDDLQAIADELNDRPRKVLGWLTPTEAFHLSLGHEVIIGERRMQLPDTLLPLAQRCVDP